VERFPIHGGKWEQVSSTPSHLNYASAVAHKDMIYMQGDGNPNMFYVYNTTTDGWVAKQHMLNRRANGQSDAARMVSIGDYIYAHGGSLPDESNGCCHSHHWGSSKMERYDPASDTWSHMASSSYHRRDHVATAHGGMMYVCAGRCHHCQGGSGWRYHNSCEKYNPATNSWSGIAACPANTNHNRHTLRNMFTTYGDYLYLWRNEATVAMWKYDVSANSWSTIQVSSALQQNFYGSLVAIPDLGQTTTSRRLQQDEDAPKQAIQTFGAIVMSSMRREVAQLTAPLAEQVASAHEKLEAQDKKLNAISEALATLKRE